MRAVLLLALFLLPLPALAAQAPLTYQYGEQTFELDPGKYPAWRTTLEHASFHGFPLRLPPPREREEELPEGVTIEREETWDLRAINATLGKVIGEEFNRDPGKVRIARAGDGTVTFEGAGLPGRAVDTIAAAHLTVKALMEEVHVIQLPVLEEAPEVLVADPELQRLGIREVVTVGESDFRNSPPNRRHNIAVGLARFNGHMIPAGEEFSFNDVLGPVNANAGYKNELTIRGDRTTPEYGGGLCQVSTTAFRGAWKAGLPITERRNHSFAVRFYAPEGTDATVYPPWKDVRFRNDTGSALLVQTLAEGDRAFFIYYGTRPVLRATEFVGPFTWDVVPPPANRIEYTTQIPEGAKRVLSQPVAGMKTMWYRIVAENGLEAKPEPFFSSYEARPYFEQIGVLPGDPRLLAEGSAGGDMEATPEEGERHREALSGVVR